jgi:serine/threonine protein phosphatase 1
MQNFLFKFFPVNRTGRDFVVGDIHGMFGSFETFLDKISFNPEKDRVFSVGDLIDRGDQSHRVLEFLNKPWFSAVMGNHESMLLDSRVSGHSLHNWTKYNGGAWWNKLPKKAQDEIYYKISKLPYLIEIETALGNIGVAHADLPTVRSWSDIVRTISTDDELKSYVLWSRQRHKTMRRTNSTNPVDGIKLAVMGHTPHKEPLRRENVFYIDTGATYINDKNLSSLTLLQIHPTLKVHQYSTYTDLQCLRNKHEITSLP